MKVTRWMVTKFQNIPTKVGMLVSILYRIYRLCKKQNLFCRAQVGGITKSREVT